MPKGSNGHRVAIAAAYWDAKTDSASVELQFLSDLHTVSEHCYSRKPTGHGIALSGSYSVPILCPYDAQMMCGRQITLAITVRFVCRMLAKPFVWDRSSEAVRANSLKNLVKIAEQVMMMIMER